LGVDYYEANAVSSVVELQANSAKSALSGLFVGQGAGHFAGAFNFEASVVRNDYMSSQSIPDSSTTSTAPVTSMFENINGVFLVPSTPVTVSPSQ
jgi:hypothetical protein